MSDIQCAAALAHSKEQNGDSKTSSSSSKNSNDRATSMNPFPGSTRGYPKTEEEIRRIDEEVMRLKKAEQVVPEEEEEEEGVEVNLNEGLDDVESADLRELMKIAGLAEDNEQQQLEEEEADTGYSDIEIYRDKLDADVASRATEIVTARATRGAQYIAEKASLSLRDLARLEPCGVLAVCPSLEPKDVEHVGRCVH